jgi:YD repeat-containing protein
MRSILLILLTFALIVFSCDDDGEKNGKDQNSHACILQGETTGLIGNEASWQYEYDEHGRLTQIHKFNSIGMLSSTITISQSSVVATNKGHHSNPIIATNYSGNIEEFPTQAKVSLTLDGIEQRNYKTFFFFYDNKKRLVKIGEQTEFILNDYEWDLHISYDDNDNVTRLQYELTTGPRDPSPPVIVSAYDQNPTPYAGIKGWKFMMSNFAWDNYDPGPILTALSKNNPLNYSSGTGATEFSRTMEYTYNDSGYPVTCKNTNKLGQSEYSFVQTYSYDCQ